MADSLACHVDGAVVPRAPRRRACPAPCGARGGGGNFARLRVFAHGVGPRGVGVGGARDVFVAELLFVAPPRSARTNWAEPTLGGTVLTLVGDHFAGTAETYGAGTPHMCVFGAGR